MPLQDHIVAYFKLDQEQRALRTGLDAAERRLGTCRKQAEQLATQKAELATLARQHQAQSKTLELVIASIQEKMDQLRSRMGAASNNKEYQALLIETQKLSQDKAEAENAAVALLGQLEAAQARQGECAKKEDEQVKIIDAAVQEVAAAKAELGDRLADVTRRRDAVALPAEVRKLYDHLVDLYEGDAVAALDPAERRRGEYVCGGCHITLPRQLLIQLLNQTERPCTCTSCGRLLYLSQAAREQLENPEAAKPSSKTRARKE